MKRQGNTFISPNKMAKMALADIKKGMCKHKNPTLREITYHVSYGELNNKIGQYHCNDCHDEVRVDCGGDLNFSKNGIIDTKPDKTVKNRYVGAFGVVEV